MMKWLVILVGFVGSIVWACWQVATEPIEWDMDTSEFLVAND